MSDTQATASLEPVSLILFVPERATHLRAVVADWQKCLVGLGRDYDISLISEANAESEGDLPNARLFSFDRNTGFRGALADAIRSSNHPVVVFCTADGQYQPSDLSRMLSALDETQEGIRAEIVAGYRRGGQAPPWRVLLDTLIGLFMRIAIGVPVEPRKCWLGSKGWTRRWIARWIFGVRVRDPECRFLVIRRKPLLRIPIQSNGPFLPLELLAKSNQLGTYMREEPVQWMPPTELVTETTTFGQDALLIFRHPDLRNCQ